MTQPGSVCKALGAVAQIPIGTNDTTPTVYGAQYTPKYGHVRPYPRAITAADVAVRPPIAANGHETCEPVECHPNRFDAVNVAEKVNSGPTRCPSRQFAEIEAGDI